LTKKEKEIETDIKLQPSSFHSFKIYLLLIVSAFEGEYGSDLENQLENDVRILTEQKDQLRTALNKWSNAKFLLVYAYNQLDCSEKRWSELMSLDIR
jgi:hypothetical protein